MAKSEKIEVENVNVPGHTSNVDKTKYTVVKKALLQILPKKPPGLTFNEIRTEIKAPLEELFPGGAKTGWWAKTVQLDLEAKGIIVRADSKPLRWHKK